MKALPMAAYRTTSYGSYNFTIMPKRINDIRSFCVDPNLPSYYYSATCGQLADAVASPSFRTELP